MAKLARATATVFGSTASSGQIAKFGSLAASAPVTYSGSSALTNVTTIQSLGNWASGWFSGVEGASSPAIEDFNAVHFVNSYQNAYLLQEGIPEWDAGTTYYKGSLANDGNGNIYVSITDTNLNNALSSTANWQSMIKLVNSGFVSNLLSPTLAASQSITLPVLPASSATLQMSSAGVLTTVLRTISATAVIGQVAQSTVGSISGGAATTPTNIVALGCTLSTAGRPVQMLLNTVNNNAWDWRATSLTNAPCASTIQFTRDSSIIAQFFIQNYDTGASSGSPPCFLDTTVTAGNHSYGVQYLNSGTNARTDIDSCQLTCYEI